MLKEFAQYLVSLKDNKIYNINGETYSDNELERIAPYTPRPKEISVSSLDSVVKLVRAEGNKLCAPIFIRIDSPTGISVFSALDSDMKRDKLLNAVCDLPSFREGWREHDKAVIELRSKFVPNEDVDYLLDLLSRMNIENGVTTQDNGVTQQVEARTGVSLKSMVGIRPRVSLAPYRTFREITQPTSGFLLRVDKDGQIGLFEADGGMWTITAKESILEYLEDHLADEVATGAVIVMT